MKKITTLLVSSFLIFGQMGYAVSAQDENSEPVSAPISDSRYSSGNSVTINEETDGDLFVSGTTIKVNERVRENLFAIGNDILIEKDVKQSAFLFGGKIETRGEISGNAFVFGGDVEINKVGDDLYVFADRVLIRGDVNDDLSIIANEVYVDEGVTFKEDVKIHANVVKLFPDTGFKGDFIDINGLSTAEQLNELVTQDIPLDLSSLPVSSSNAGTRSMLSGSGLLMLFASVIGSALAAYVIFKLFPVKSKRILENFELDKVNIRKNLKVGFKALVISIIGFVVLLVSVVGWPLLAIFIFLGLAVNQLSKLYFAYKVGSVIVKKVQRKASSIPLDTFVGTLVILTVFMILTTIPVIGNAIASILGFVIMLWSVGGILRVKYEDYKKANTKK